MTDIMQASLTGGELSPSLYGRVDLQRYGISLKTCRNFQVSPYGGIYNRTGSKYVAACKDDGYGSQRLIPFTSASQSYALELGRYYLRIVKSGAQVVYAARSAWVTGTAYVVGDTVTVSTVSYRCITAHTAAAAFGTDAAKWHTIGTVGQVAEVTTPWLMSDLRGLHFTQSADVMTVVHPSYPPYEIRRYGHDDWEVTARSLASGPFQELNTDAAVTISASAATGTVTLTAASAIFTADKVGKYLYMAIGNIGRPWEVDTPVVSGEICRSGSNYYVSVSNGSTGTKRPTHSVGTSSDGKMLWTYLHEGFGVCLVNSVGGTTASATVVSRLPDGGTVQSINGISNPITFSDSGGKLRLNFTYAHGLSNGDIVKMTFTLLFAPITNTITVANAGTLYFDTPFDYSTFGAVYPPSVIIEELVSTGVDVTPNWAWQEWDSTRGYPSAVCYFQQSLVFGGSLASPQTIWKSRVGDFANFLPHGLQVYDDDALAIPMDLSSVNGNQYNQIRNILPLEKLVAMLSSGCATVGNGLHDPLTPDNQTIELQGSFGSSALAPIAIGGSVIYQTDKSKGLRDLEFDSVSYKYGGQDITVMASHLFEDTLPSDMTISEWAYQNVPWSTLWCIRNDGVMLGLTYLKEQQVLAWHRHDTGAFSTYQDKFQSVCVVSEGSEDALYVIASRYKKVGSSWVSANVIERFVRRSFAATHDCFFVDSGLTYDSTPATTFTGFGHLAGRTVSVLADGLVLPQVVVSASGGFTVSTSASVVQAGLPIQADGETLAIVLPMGAESSTTKKKTIPAVTFMLKNSGSFEAGPDVDTLGPVFDATTGTGGTTLVTGLFEKTIDAQWKQDGTVFFRQDDPLPVDILAIIPTIKTGG